MEDFWALALWVLTIWLYLIISLIMIPAMFGFSLGISETYMTILVKTLEVLCFFYTMFLTDSLPRVHIEHGYECLLSVLLYSGPL